MVRIAEKGKQKNSTGFSEKLLRITTSADIAYIPEPPFSSRENAYLRKNPAHFLEPPCYKGEIAPSLEKFDKGLREAEVLGIIVEDDLSPCEAHGFSVKLVTKLGVEAVGRIGGGDNIKAVCRIIQSGGDVTDVAVKITRLPGLHHLRCQIDAGNIETRVFQSPGKRAGPAAEIEHLLSGVWTAVIFEKIEVLPDNPGVVLYLPLEKPTVKEGNGIEQKAMSADTHRS